MNSKFIALSALISGLALSSNAQLVFSNITTVVGSSPTNLQAVVVGGTAGNSIVAVGDNSRVFARTLNPDFSGGPLNTPGTWGAASVPSNSYSLKTVTYGNGIFAAAGSNNVVFASADAGVSWNFASKVFSNGVEVPALAFDGSSFVAAPASPQISRSATLAQNSWNIGSNATPYVYSFLESFRGVTAFGAGNFAAVGAQGIIRRSTDGGRTWYGIIGVTNTFSRPNLLGVASDNASRLVAVGTNGTILTSLDAGLTWTTNTPALLTNRVLHAVSYLNPGFIAVGSDNGTNGLVLASADGVTWTTNTSLPINRNLRGVSFGQGGTLQGVGLVVGENGTVMLGGVLPAPPANPQSKTNCADTPPNPALIVDNIPDAYHPAGTVTVDWFDAPVGGNLVTNDSISFYPTNTAAANDNTPGIYRYYAQSRDRRTGFINSARTEVIFQVNPRPKAHVSGNATICNGDSTIIQAALSGTAPWTVTWSSNGIAVAVFSNIFSNLHSYTVTPVNTNLNNAITTVYTVTALSDGNTCDAFPSNFTGSASITINPRPTATLTTTNTICNGQTTAIGAFLTGIGPWTVRWADGVVQVTNTTLGNPVTLVRQLSSLEVTNLLPNLPTTHFFYVTSVSNATGCTASQPGDIQGTNSVTVNPRPTATLTDTNIVCNGQPSMIRALLTGIGPWTVRWSDGTVQTTNAALGDSATLVRELNAAEVTNVFANLPTNHFFHVTSISNATACLGNQPGDLRGTNLVTVNPRPTATLNDNLAICNGQPVTIQAMLTGLGPWTVRWSDGFEQTTNAPQGSAVTLLRGFTSAEVTNVFANHSTNYAYWVLSVSNATTCVANQPGDINGTNTVTVNPRPTATLNDNLTICNGQTATIHALLTGLGPWTVRWSDGTVQTTNAAPGDSVTLARTLSSAEVTNTLANLPTNHYFYVTSVSNATSCIGNQAGDLSGTNQVIVNPRPTATLNDNLVICNGQPVTIQALLTGLGPWTVRWSDGFEQTTNAAVGNAATLLRAFTSAEVTNFFANLPTNYSYHVLSVSNATTCVANQPGDITGTNRVTVNPRPTATLTDNLTICNGQTVAIHALLTGIGPWTVRWSDGVMQTTNVAQGNAATLRRLLSTAEVTNTFADLPTNHYFYVTLVSNVTTCVGNQPGDLQGTNVVTVNPVSTATVAGTTNIFVPDTNAVTAVITAELHGLGPWQVIWNDGVSNNVAGPGPVMLTREVTNHLSRTTVVTTNCTEFFTGGPNAGECKPNKSTVVTNSTFAAQSFTYYVTSLADTTSNCDGAPAQLTNLANRATVTLSPGVFALVTRINGPDICSGNLGLLRVDLTGFAPWTVIWSDGVTNVVTNGFTREVTAAVAVTTTNFYWITNLVDGSGSNAAPANLGGTNAFVFIPLPANSLLSASVTNCVGITNPPITVLPSGGNTVNWYDAATNLVAAATNSFTPTNQTVGTHAFYVTEVNAGGCESTNLVQLNLVIQACTNAINSISLQNTNAIIEWYGNYVLQHATNLVPPVTWHTLTQGLSGTLNSWTNSTTPPPNENYFRLYAPTNSP